MLMNDRPHLLLVFKRILYAESEDDKDDLYESLLSDDVVLKYPNFSTYVTFMKIASHGLSVTELTYP